MTEFIYDVEQVKLFHSLLSPLKPEEAYFLSLSARNKYLTPEERKEIDLGRTEMFARKLVKKTDFSTFLRVLRSYEVHEDAYTSRSDIRLPSKCLVVYANINPVSGKKALKEFYEKTNQLLFDLSDNPEAYGNLAKLDTILMNCYQRARGTLSLLDIDFDVPEIALVQEACLDFKNHGVIYHVIQTKSGYHVLIERASLHYNYTQVVKHADDEAKRLYGHAEVVVNSNEMVPIPGTRQADALVKFVEV